MKYNIIKVVKFFTDTLLLSTACLLFKTVIDGYTSSVKEMIDYSSLYFFQLIFICGIIVLLINLCILWRKSAKNRKA